MLKTKNEIALLVSAAVIISIAVWVIYTPQKRKDPVQEHKMTVIDTTKNKTRNIDSIDYEDEVDRNRARKVTTKIYTIDDFSVCYYGKVTVFDAGEFYAPGKAEIYRKKNDRKLICIKSSTITAGLFSSKPNSNNKIKYGEQDVIVCEDFNFDGIKDFAFLDGDYNKYCTPSYTVYLTLNRKIVYSKKLTNLVRQNLGMFDVDRERKILSVYNKSGYCYNEYKEYKVINNSPVIVFIQEEETKDNYFFKTTKRLLNNGKWSKKTTKEKA
ncbi:MAG: hypothetical protein WC644_01755 [Ignavibacteria bacterium]